MELKNMNVTVANMATNYFELAITTLEVIPQTGITVAEMRARLELKKKIEKEKEDSEKAGMIADLEASEVALLQHCVRNCQWRTMDKNIVAFSEYIEGIKEE